MGVMLRFDLARQYEVLDVDGRTLGQRVEEATRAVRSSGVFLLGPAVSRFEQQWAAYCRVEHAVGVASGTDALKLALLACGVQPGNEVIVPALSFIGTADAVCAIGARPIFVDVDSGGALDTQQVAAAVTGAARALIPVHLWGTPADMVSVLATAEAHELVVVEDCAQAHGALTCRGQPIGTLGDAGCFSFSPGKNLGAEGEVASHVWWKRPTDAGSSVIILCSG